MEKRAKCSKGSARGASGVFRLISFGPFTDARGCCICDNWDTWLILKHDTHHNKMYTAWFNSWSLERASLWGLRELPVARGPHLPEGRLAMI